MHAVGDMHTIPLSELDTAPVGLGVAWSDHDVPSQRSASVVRRGKVFPVVPTAVHAVGDAQETPEKKLEVAPAGLGVATIAHLLPFQVWAIGTTWPVLRSLLPTAIQEMVDEHETPVSRP
ncbi:MAG: hypothetical protein E6J12_12785 [Chloroflexi bacterium]|nr:MAG: hypothetical protein E6J12_12785 [Chloroflexota bacterium]